ncbi:hypothetical protein NVSP9465_00040 [Novosphingobium sp. CECT 9465]|nr:hypothetical protein NVSP9465_00040 [Novosphingobium sp. CECT 9465]
MQLIPVMAMPANLAMHPRAGGNLRPDCETLEKAPATPFWTL